jgi:endonuclease G
MHVKNATTFFSAGLIAGFGLFYASTSGGGSPLPSAPAGPTASAEQRVLLGTGALAHRRVSDAFVAEYDPSRRNPRWVAERLTRAMVLAAPAADRAREAFHEEAALPPLMRARLAAYADSGYDRGHLAPAADHRHSRAALRDTFFLSNVVPQHPAHNRDFWARVERFVRDLLREKWDTAYVVTGPLYLPSRGKGRSSEAFAWRNPALGEPLQWVAVPTHLFKVVYARNEGGGGGAGPVVGAFVVPNAPVPADAPLARFAVPLAAVEAASGLRLLRGGVGEGEEGAAEAPLGRVLLENAARVMLGDEALAMRLPPALAAPPHQPLFTPAGTVARLRHVCEATPCALQPPVRKQTGEGAPVDA